MADEMLAFIWKEQDRVLREHEAWLEEIDVIIEKVVTDQSQEEVVYEVGIDRTGMELPFELS